MTKTIEDGSSAHRRQGRRRYQCLFALLTACATAHPAPEQQETSAATTAQAQTAAPQPETKSGPDAHSRRLFDEANARYEDQAKAGTIDYAGLEQRYRDAAEETSFAEPEYDLGVLFQQQGKLDEAVAAYQEALRRKPQLAEAATNLAAIYRIRGQADQALKLLEDTARQRPTDGSSRAQLADIYQQKGLSDEAKEMAKQALARDPKNLLAYRVLIEQSLTAGDDEMVRLLALKAAKISAKDPTIPYALARLALKRKDVPAAVLQLKGALGLDAAYEPALALLAKVAFEHQDYPTAEKDFRHLIQLNPKTCGAHLDLGVVERSLGHLDVAEQEYQAALQCDAALTAAYYDLGLLYHHQKNDCTKAQGFYRDFIAKSAEGLAGTHPVFAALQECQQLDAMKQKEDLQKEQDKQQKKNAPPSAAPAPAAEQAKDRGHPAGAASPGSDAPPEPAEKQDKPHDAAPPAANPSGSGAVQPAAAPPAPPPAAAADPQEPAM